MIRLLVTLACALTFSTASLADDEYDFTIEELADMSKLAFTTLKEQDPELAKKIYAFSSNLAENETFVRLMYKDDEGRIQRVTFLCHFHGFFECHRQ